MNLKNQEETLTNVCHLVMEEVWTLWDFVVLSVDQTCMTQREVFDGTFRWRWGT